tara:strand:- start:42 stop:218 length:177 start_codon:yes stop_codon:yes gene_type:complete
MIDFPDRQYWERRERQALKSAERAQDGQARRAHREMAQRYSAMAHDRELADSTIPERG